MQSPQEKSRRNKLLAMAHIAPKELGLDGEDVREILAREFKKNSRADLTEMELGYLIDWFRQHGWQAQSAKRRVQSDQCEILRTRVYETASHIHNGDRRLRGLAKKILGVDALAWCRDVKRLQRLLAVLEKIKKTEGEVLWD